jgi:proliferating cell nuclear antigen PCNA
MSASMPEDDSDNIFEFRTTQCQPFKILFDILKESVSSGNIYFTHSGIKIRTYDRGQTQYIDVLLEAENFDHYYYASEDPDEIFYININIPFLNNVLKSITPSDNIIKWSYKNNEPVLKIIIQNKNNYEHREYTITTNDNGPTDDEPPSNIDDYNYVLLLPCADLSSIFKHFKQLEQESITIKFVNNNLIFSTSNKGNVKATITKYSESDINEFKICKSPEKISCYCDEFKFDKLHNLSKCVKISGKKNNFVKIRLLSENPIVFNFNIGKLGYVNFYVSPNNSSD